MRRLTLAVFLDACGWHLIESRPWWLPELRHRQPLTSVFGYSSACLPAIFSGRLPNENDHWSFWRYDPAGSPFRDAPWLRWAGTAARVPALRRRLERHLARSRGWRGYFALYEMPPARLASMSWSETKDLFAPGGLNRGKGIFDDLADSQTPHHVSNWREPEASRFAAAEREVERGEASFVFVYAADLDGLMHREGPATPGVDAYLAKAQARIRRLRRKALARYDEVRTLVFSDHGMAAVRQSVDLRSPLARTGLRWGRDYASVLDSTMARFWFLRPGAEERLRGALEGVPGAFVTPAQARAWGVHWEDGRFGDAVYALPAGTLLVPSDLGRRPIAGMHGYCPSDAASDATLLADHVPQQELRQLTDLYGALRDSADWASPRITSAPATDTERTSPCLASS